MYPPTPSTWDALTENTPKPRCQANGVVEVNVSWNHFDELALVTCRTPELARVGLSFARM